MYKQASIGWLWHQLCIQPVWMENRSHSAVLCHCVYRNEHVEKRKKTRELSEKVRHKIVAKHEQSQGYKSIYRDLDVPVSTVRNVIRKFQAHFEIATLSSKCWKLCLNDDLTFRFRASNSRLKVPVEQNWVTENALVGHAQKASFRIHMSFQKLCFEFCFF